MSLDNGHHQRTQPGTPIELRVEYRKLNSFFADYARNIAKGGTFIRTRKSVPVGTRFLFKLHVPERTEPFALVGEVVSTNADGEELGMGIRFVFSSDVQRSELKGIVEKMMRESLGPLLSGKLLETASGHSSALP